MTHIADKASPAVQWLDITDDQAGQRIDNYLINLLKGVPKSRIYRILRKGEVRVNKGRIKPEYKLQPGDQVRVPPVRVAEQPENYAPREVCERIESAILFEDKGLIVLNKPSGLAVHGGSGLSFGIIEALRVSRPDAPYLELVHRLDRETSGCLLIAKKRSFLRNLHEQLRGTDMRKRYWALLMKPWAGGRRTVSAALRKNVQSSGERFVRVDEEHGKLAKSIFEPLEVYKDCSLVGVELLSGRTHQIRVHAAHIGHPVAGDDKYGDDAFNKLMKAKGLGRMFLHARQLSFDHPQTEQRIDITAPLDSKLEKLLKSLEVA